MDFLISPFFILVIEYFLEIYIIIASSFEENGGKRDVIACCNFYTNCSG